MLSGNREPSRPKHPGTFLTREPGKDAQHPGVGSVDFPVSVVLPAGGTGERTGLQTPKQFCSVLGRPLISFTIQAFERVPWIQTVAVAVAKENTELMGAIVQRFGHKKVRVVAGGATRHRSICNGVLALAQDQGPSRPHVVVIHDAVRPFVEEDFLLKMAMAAKEHGAAGAIRPLVSTVIATTSEGYLDHSLERAKYRASEMPQAFSLEVIQQAYQRCSEWDFEFGTECLHLALQYCGTNAKLMEGPPTLWKVTYKRDLAAAESIIKESLSGSGCLLGTGAGSASAPAATLAASLRKAAGALGTELVEVPELRADDSRCLQEWNFIQISTDHGLSELEATLEALKEVRPAPLQPLVLLWVHLQSREEASVSEAEAALPATLMDLATEAQPHNVLLYGIRLRWSEDGERWERSVSRLAELTSALVRERSPALAGQLLQA